jgi:hypothetical protein
MATKKMGEKDVWKIGHNYFIRTVTNYFTGKLKYVSPTELVLGEAAWIADTGRFSDALKTWTPNEVEPYPGDVIIGRGAIVDASIWDGALPREKK